MSGFDYAGAFRSGEAPERVVERITLDPSWHFEDNPVKAISWASTWAAQFAENGRREVATYFARLALGLCAAAGHEPGAVLGDLARAYGIDTAPTIA